MSWTRKETDCIGARGDMAGALCEAVKIVNGKNPKRSNISFHQALPGTIPQQAGELCGFYFMAYLEIFARDP